MADHSGNAAWAAATASFSSAVLAKATCPLTSPKLGIKYIADSPRRALDRLPIYKVLVGFTHSLSAVT